MISLYRLPGLLLLAFLGLLNSCALLGQGATWHPPLVVVPDSAGTPFSVIYAKNYYAGSYKDHSDHRAQGGGTYAARARAPVATGTSQAQDFTRAGQRGGAVAAAPGASATTRTGVPGWVVVAGGVVLLLLLLLVLAYRFRNKLFTP